MQRLQRGRPQQVALELDSGILGVRVITLDGALQNGLNGSLVADLHRLLQEPELVMQLLPTEVGLIRFKDARMLSGLRVCADEQFLVELLARPQTSVDDFDIALRIGLVAHFEIGETHHHAGEVVDAHGVAHVQHEHLAARRHASPQ